MGYKYHRSRAILKGGNKMKELDYEDWQKNPTPRMMWVWDDNDAIKVKRKVVYVLKDDDFTSLALVVKNECMYGVYHHCAEIKEQRRMTNKELSRWLREKPTREYKCTLDSYIYGVHTYDEDCEEEVSEKIRIRENYGEWREPLVEVEE